MDRNIVVKKNPGKMRRPPLTRSEIMSRVKSKDSGAERALRSALHAAGLRFRLHRRVEGVTLDVAFPNGKVAVLIDGCFWHGCPRHATYPRSNTSYWLPKLAENKERDKRQSACLRKAGWKVFRIWEHDCLPPNTRVVSGIVEACLNGRSSR